MAGNDSRITIHMAASLDGYVARADGSVDWMETADEFAGGEELDIEPVTTPNSPMYHEDRGSNRVVGS